MKHKKHLLILVALLVTSLLVAGCGSTEAPAGETGGGEAALTVTGSVDEELSLTMGDLEGMDTAEVDYEDKDGNVETYTGVPVNDLLAETGLGNDASMISFVASDGYSADLDLAELEGCGDCVVAFDDGELRMVLPGFSGKVQVKGVVELQAK